MNINIRQISYLILTVAVVLLLNTAYWQIGKAKDINNDSRNFRPLLREFSRLRGQILTREGEIIAQSIPSNDTYKFQRVYPKQRAFVNISGYFSPQFMTDGLERVENSILSGVDDRFFGRRFMDLLAGRNPKGGNVVTTISSPIQATAYKQLATGCAGKPCKGAIVALKPSTGEILAMASTPSYDPNQIATHDLTKASNYWTQINALKSAPLLNRPIAQLYPPGSTFKVITTIAALEQGISPSTALTSAASIVLPQTNTSLTNYGSTPCPNAVRGKVTLSQAFAYSCNTAFVDLTTRVMPNGISALQNTAERFGFNHSPANIPLPVAASSTGNIADKAALGQSSIGQRNVRLTPLMNAEIAATIANNGVHMRPYLVKELDNSNLSPVEEFSPISLGQVVDPQINAEMVELMRDSERHSGQNIAGVEISSKTGTAEHGEGRYPHSWYIAFTPATQADIAVAVVIEDGGAIGMNATGAAVAAPLGRQVIMTAIRLQGEKHVATR